MKKITRITENDLTRLVKKIIKEESSKKNKCSSFETSECATQIKGDSEVSLIVNDILLACNCLQYYYLSYWDSNLFYRAVSKIANACGGPSSSPCNAGQKMYNKVESTLKCFIKKAGWKIPEDSIISLFDDMNGNDLNTMKVYKSYSKLYRPKNPDSKMKEYLKYLDK